MTNENKNKRYYWIKLKDTFFTSDTVDFLMSQKNGANYVVLYQMKEENKISFRRYGKSIGMTDIFRIADEMKFELFKQREKNNG